jgi:hypothetical protein
MTEDEAKPYAKPIPNWIPETRTVIVCWMMFSCFLIIMTLLLHGAPLGDNRDMLNTLLGMYVGTGLLTSITWWMGSSKGSDANNKLQDKMADAIRPALQLPAKAVDPWWNKLMDAERAAIGAEGPNDPKIAAFLLAPVTAKPNPDDLAYLVSKGLLTQDRATALQAA